jgi:DNA-binding MarR family transcriptional regulator
MARAISALESHLGYWLRFVSNHVSHAFRLKVEAHGVTVAEWVVLRVLFESGEIHPSAVAERIGMTRGAISKLVDRLAAKRLVACGTGKEDRRYQVVRLSAAGRDLVPVLAGLADANDCDFFGCLSAPERAELFALLKKLVQTQGLKSIPVT